MGPAFHDGYGVGGCDEIEGAVVVNFEEMWAEQSQLQRDIGLDPIYMTDADKAAEVKNMLLGIYEEVTELSRIAANYKRHLLRTRPPERANLKGELVDILKYTITIAQMYGVTREELIAEFHDKTEVVRDRAEAERLMLERSTKLLCVDLDDCISDLSEWPKQLNELQGGVPREHHKLVESYKDEFHNSGRFRDLPVITGARATLQALRDDRWTIVIVTARPVWQFKRIYADTLYWLNKHDIPRDLLLFNKDKVEAIHQHLAPAWPVAFVEDHPRNAISLASAHVHVLLYDQEHNQDVNEGEYIKRVGSWADILEALRDGQED
jgi:NTP pyrophosphatase (non-canonical NTP hydrolase)